MTTPKGRRPGGGTTGASETTIGEIGTVRVQRTPDDPPIIRGWVYAPHRGRGQHMILVRRCPHCAAAHRHTSPWLADLYRRCCPVTGWRYVVRAMVDRDTARVVRHAA